MRTYDEMYSLILKEAESNDGIRAMTMEGSSVTSEAVHDAFSDFDITFFVSDIRDFTNDKAYMERFGKILIMQCPDDWYEEPYDYSGRENFAYLTQYEDGNRIDLTFVDISNISKQADFTEPRKVLVNKDGFSELKDIDSLEAFLIKKPSEFEFYNTCNEFRWIANYVTKGLCRKELYYAKRCMDEHMMDMFMKMINWKVGIDNDFRVTTGSKSKYLKRFLSEDEMKRFAGVFANGEYEDIWEKLFSLYDFFADLARYVSKKLGFPFDEDETKRVRDFMEGRRGDALTVSGKTEVGPVKIYVKDILYIETVDDKTFAYTLKEVVRLEYSLTAVLEKLSDISFFRCSKSMIINIDKVERLKSLPSNRIDATMQGGEHIIISRTYATDFRKRLMKGGSSNER